MWPSIVFEAIWDSIAKGGLTRLFLFAWDYSIGASGEGMTTMYENGYF